MPWRALKISGTLVLARCGALQIAVAHHSPGRCEAGMVHDHPLWSPCARSPVAADHRTPGLPCVGVTQPPTLGFLQAQLTPLLSRPKGRKHDRCRPQSSEVTLRESIHPFFCCLSSMSAFTLASWLPLLLKLVNPPAVWVASGHRFGHGYGHCRNEALGKGVTPGSVSTGTEVV